ncbi:uncharacterized protein LOC110828572 isoform X1 [Zootermopsis nevadensis]|uniref:uncharacterized protein LOC110828572 isoform X1 n=1 Tax=Zootermopsis nevadensis TaxID=136037 RepID=UPI000B8E4F68|nr:uncharacterized protein LOC110828572 isoform X1 [Zootermopsis nevadensis]
MEEVWKTGVVMGGERRQDEFKDLVKTLEVLNLQNQDNDAEIEFLVSGYDREQDIQELKENEFKELESNVTEIKKRLSKLQMKKFENEEHDSRRKEECARLKENEETLRKELHDTCAAVQSLKEDVDHLYEGTTPSKEDAAILERNRDLLRLYKNLTGLKWDYTAPPSDYTGSVFNFVNNYCNYFHYPAGEASVQLVWDEIQRAAHAVWSDINGQEPLP